MALTGLAAAVSIAEQVESSYDELLQARSAQALRHYDGTRPGAAGLEPLARYGFPLADWPMIMTPMVLERSTAAAAALGFQALIKAADVVTTGYAQDWLAVASDFGLQAHQADLLALPGDGQDWARVARPDIIFHEGRPQFLELNVGPPIGGLAISDLLRECLHAWPAGDSWAASAELQPMWTMDLLVADLRSTLTSADDLVVIAYWGHEVDNMPPHFYRALAGELCRRGVRATPVAVEDLDLGGSVPRLAGEQVACLYRFFDESDGTVALKSSVFDKLAAHITGGSVQLYGNFRGNLLINKAFLARLSQWAHIDSPHLAGLSTLDRHVIGEVLPWSRVVEKSVTSAPDGHEIDLLSFIRTHRSDLVLKPTHGHGGRDIQIGRAVTPTAWSIAVDAALAQPLGWVVQQLVDVAPRPATRVIAGKLVRSPTRNVAGIFFIEREFAGGIRRSAATTVWNVNPSQGAAQGALVVV